MTHGPAIRKTARSADFESAAHVGTPPSSLLRHSGCRRQLRALRGARGLMKPENSGCRHAGVEVNSGWNWLATNQGWSAARSSPRAVAREAGERSPRIGAVE
jgi:hypothetical protein